MKNRQQTVFHFSLAKIEHDNDVGKIHRLIHVIRYIH